MNNERMIASIYLSIYLPITDIPTYHGEEGRLCESEAFGDQLVHHRRSKEFGDEFLREEHIVEPLDATAVEPSP